MQRVSHFTGQVICLDPVLVAVIQLPDVIVESRERKSGKQPCGHIFYGTQTFVVYAAVVEHLEVLHIVTLSRGSFAETLQ